MLPGQRRAFGDFLDFSTQSNNSMKKPPAMRVVRESENANLRLAA
jgi:hypothetical protein